MRVEINSKVTKGQLAARESARLASALLALDGKHAIITVTEKKRDRTSQQNRYYWGVVVETVMNYLQDQGNYVDSTDVHEFLKLRVGKLSRVIVVGDDVHKCLGSTAQLSTAKFNEYIEKIRAWAADYGIVIPEPNE